MGIRGVCGVECCGVCGVCCGVCGGCGVCGEQWGARARDELGTLAREREGERKNCGSCIFFR